MKFGDMVQFDGSYGDRAVVVDVKEEDGSNWITYYYEDEGLQDPQLVIAEGERWAATLWDDDPDPESLRLALDDEWCEWISFVNIAMEGWNVYTYSSASDRERKLAENAASSQPNVDEEAIEAGLKKFLQSLDDA
jgi:hypothetical protein